ncbi:fucose-binding lectin II [Streptomyces sp. NPDC020807]|uniref:fucose-binding lectin II n=1 Tax=Streptomyces sp. NPDC020807 TaxID=3155119 RepID=UPI0033EC2E42
MADAYVLVNGNKAEINLPADAQITVTAKTNSRLPQKVALTSQDGTVNHLFTGSGEANTVIGQATFTGASRLGATFEFSPSGSFSPSKLNSGGPYELGTYNVLLIVAENGDDSDYNDSILEFSWYTPKQ